jgi:hypothetical protein
LGSLPGSGRAQAIGDSGVNKMDILARQISMIVTTFTTIASESRYDLLP